MHFFCRDNRLFFVCVISHCMLVYSVSSSCRAVDVMNSGIIIIILVRQNDCGQCPHTVVFLSVIATGQLCTNETHVYRE